MCLAAQGALPLASAARRRRQNLTEAGNPAIIGSEYMPIHYQSEGIMSAIQTITSGFATVRKAALSTIAASTQRVYARTYDAWQDWCSASGVDPLDVYAATVLEFLTAQAVGKGTRQRHLSALRTLAKVLALDYTDPRRQAMYESLKMLRVPTEGAAGKERQRRALSPKEVDRVFRTWDGDGLTATRNRALLAVMFYVGARRSEIVALRWSDVDFENGVVRIRHGKGDKARDAAIVGDDALDALRHWQLAAGMGREYVFCPLVKGGRLGADKPLSTNELYKVDRLTAQRSGVDFKPHDARRTLATELLALGTPTPDVQAQLGHAHASTTIQNYGMPADARTRRKRMRVRY